MQRGHDLPGNSVCKLESDPCTDFDQALLQQIVIVEF
jgi:hypothetical protein